MEARENPAPFPLRILRADPAGNITLYVLDPVDPSLRPRVTAQLLSDQALQAEQVAYCCPPLCGGLGRIEMAGGEFCGNAARAYAMLLARELGPKVPSPLLLEVSGCAGPVRAEVDLPAGTAQVEMPLPRAIRRLCPEGRPCTLVDLEGIAHLVVENVPPSLEFYRQQRHVFGDIPGLEAQGVMFLEEEGHRMTPLVEVPAAGSLVWEGSCGSGSLAAAVALCLDLPDGSYTKALVQPAGTVQVSLTMEGGRVIRAAIGGSVRLDDPVEIVIL